MAAAAQRQDQWWKRHAFLGVALALVVGPTLARLAQQSWTLEEGAHGPIVLATGLWLIWHTRSEWNSAAGAKPNSAWIAIATLVVSVTYALGRALDLLVVEAAAAYLMALLAMTTLFGISAIRSTPFPFFYLAFLIPPPGWVIDMLTSTLREGISRAAAASLELLGYPVAREGVVIVIGPYRLLVEDACSGINSLVGLTAISLFYIFMMHRANWRHTLLLTAAIIPVAIIANFIRVVALILVTHYLGDAVAQGAFHEAAGMMLFAIALGLMVLADRTIIGIEHWRQRRLAR